MGLKDIGSKLPPGFRFHPSDEELVSHYLCNKIKAKSDHGDIEDEDEALKSSTDLIEIDLHICEPWQLPDVAKLNAKEWYFFSFRDKKYATGYRTNRATISGYWKATGKDRTVMNPKTKRLAGMRKTLVFYRNRAPNGIKTNWIMHEFRLECPNIPPKEDWVLCRVFNKGRDSNNDHQTQRLEINDGPELNYAPNYDNLLPPLLSSPPHNQRDEKMKIQVCDQWEQLMKQNSRTTDHHPYHHHQCNHQTIACGWEQMMIGHGPDHESLLNLLYVDNTNKVNINDNHSYGKILLSSDMTSLENEKTCMGSSSDGGMVSELHMECGGLSSETDNLFAFH